MVGHRVEVPLDLDVVVRAPAFALRRSANSNSTAGSTSSGFSSRSNTTSRESSRFWNGRALISAAWSKMASFNSSKPDEPTVSQCRSDLSCDKPDTALGRWLVTWRSNPGRDDRGAVMLRELRIGPVQLRFVPVRTRHPRAQVVRHQQPGRAPEELERMHMGLDPRPQSHIGECLHIRLGAEYDNAATNTHASRTSPVTGSTNPIGSPAQSTSNDSPGLRTIRIDALVDCIHRRYCSLKNEY